MTNQEGQATLALAHQTAGGSDPPTSSKEVLSFRWLCQSSKPSTILSLRPCPHSASPKESGDSWTHGHACVRVFFQVLSHRLLEAGGRCGHAGLFPTDTGVFPNALCCTSMIRRRLLPLTASLLVPGWWLTNRAQHRQHRPVRQNADLPERGGRLLLLPQNGSCYC